MLEDRVKTLSEQLTRALDAQKTGQLERNELATAKAQALGEV